jgi:hypothetical protein
MLNGVFNAAQGRRVHHFSGGADDEEIAKTLVEDDLRPDAGIRAADNDREWVLAFGDRAAGFGDLFGTGMG